MTPPTLWALRNYWMVPYGKHCLSYRGATIWNSLEISIKEPKSCITFKHLVKIFQKFETQRGKYIHLLIAFLLLFYFCLVFESCSVNIIGFNVTFLFILSLICKQLLEGTTIEISVISVLRGLSSVVPVILIYPLAIIVCFMYLQVSMLFYNSFKWQYNLLTYLLKSVGSGFLTNLVINAL